MKITDIIRPETVGTDRRVSVRVRGCTIILPKGCTVRAMSPLACWLAGSLTPGMTTGAGIRLNENLLPLLSIETVCHEATHWWQARYRMGAWSYAATYYWHVLLCFLKGNGSHWHDVHPMEVEARRCGRSMAGTVLNVIDVEEWLSAHLPRTRS